MKPASTTSAGWCAVDRGGQLGFERLACGEALVVDHVRGDLVFARQRQAAGVRAVADDGRHPGAHGSCASLRAGRTRTMAAMLEPPPEIRITMFFICEAELSQPCPCVT